MVQLSVVFPVIALIALLSFRSKKLAAIFNGDIKILVLSFLLFPLGYLLVNFESRYIWYMVPLGMVIGGLLLQHYSSVMVDLRFHFLFIITFLNIPVWGMKKMYHIGEDAYKIANELKRRNIHGSFAAYAEPGLGIQRLERIAYFSGNPLYILRKQNSSVEDLLKAMRRYSVNYWLIYDDSSYSFERKSSQIFDQNQNKFPDNYFEVKDVAGGIKVYTINPYPKLN